MLLRRGGDEEDILYNMRHQKFMTQIHTSGCMGSVMSYKFLTPSDLQFFHI